MSSVIVIFGSTGSQGNSVARALIASKKFKVRAVSRDTASAKAEALSKAGAEVVSASFDDKESLERVLKGAYGAFFLTSFWDSGKGTVEDEVRLGRNVAEAAKNCGVKHLVYSTLESPAAMAGQHFPTFDAKVGVEQEILYAGVPFTFVQVAWYFNNLENNRKNAHAGWYPWPRDEQGRYVLSIPIGTNGLHGIDNDDVGVAVARMFEEPQEYLGRKVALSGELVTGESMVIAFEQTFPNVKFVYVNLELEEYRKTTSGFGDALYHMYKWYQFRMPRGGDLDLTKKLNPGVKDFKSYLMTNQQHFNFQK